MLCEPGHCGNYANQLRTIMEHATAINMSKQLNDFCEKYDLCEYGMSYIVTMPNGYSFITNDIELSNRMLREHGASTRHIVELGE